MANLTQAERMVAVETNLKNLDKKVEEGFTDIKGDLKELTMTVQQLVPTLVTQTQLTERVTELDKEIVGLKNDLSMSNRKNSLQTWVTSSLTALFAVILTILVQSYFKG